MSKLHIPMQLVKFIAEKESFDRPQVVFCKQYDITDIVVGITFTLIITLFCLNHIYFPFFHNEWFQFYN